MPSLIVYPEQWSMLLKCSKQECSIPCYSPIQGIIWVSAASITLFCRYWFTIWDSEQKKPQWLWNYLNFTVLGDFRSRWEAHIQWLERRRNLLRRTKDVDQNLLLCVPGTAYENNGRDILVFFLSFCSINRWIPYLGCVVRWRIGSQLSGRSWSWCLAQGAPASPYAMGVWPASP